MIPPGWTAEVHFVSAAQGGSAAYVAFGAQVTAANGWPVTSGNPASLGVALHEPARWLYAIADKGAVTICVALCHM